MIKVFYLKGKGYIMHISSRFHISYTNDITYALKSTDEYYYYELDIVMNNTNYDFEIRNFDIELRKQKLKEILNG